MNLSFVRKDFEHQKMPFFATFWPKNAIFSHFLMTFFAFAQILAFFIRMMHCKGVLFVGFCTVRVSNFVAYFCTVRVRFWKSIFRPNLWWFSERVPPPGPRSTATHAPFDRGGSISNFGWRLQIMAVELLRDAHYQKPKHWIYYFLDFWSLTGAYKEKWIFSFCAQFIVYFVRTKDQKIYIAFNQELFIWFL